VRLALAAVAIVILFGIVGRMDRDDARREEARRACVEAAAAYVGVEDQCIDDYYRMKGWR
jgi:hypothetical protein